MRAAGSEEKLMRLFQKNMDELQFNTYQSDMNNTTTIIVERLANLRLQSVTIQSPKDEPGVLATIASVFAADNINLTAEDSHLKGETVQFMLGVDEKSDVDNLEKTYQTLAQLGFEVVEHQKTPALSFE